MARNTNKKINTFVFDLDNTLYPPEVALFDQIEIKMTRYVMEALSVGKEQADHLRAQYWAQYGTTLAGLMDVHGVDPGPYLHEVHDIDFSVIPPDEKLAMAIGRLDGNKFIYTNGTAEYASKVAKARGLDGLFDGIFRRRRCEFQAQT